MYSWVLSQYVTLYSIQISFNPSFITHPPLLQLFVLNVQFTQLMQPPLFTTLLKDFQLNFITFPVNFVLFYQWWWGDFFQDKKEWRSTFSTLETITHFTTVTRKMLTWFFFNSLRSKGENLRRLRWSFRCLLCIFMFTLK